MLEYYKASDVFVHPTSYDVWGLVINEAMANGLPVLVSDHCIAGLELIRNGINGYVVEMGNEKALCEKAVSVLNDSELRGAMANAAIRTISSYTIENMAKVHGDAFKTVYDKAYIRIA